MILEFNSEFCGRLHGALPGTSAHRSLLCYPRGVCVSAPSANHPCLLGAWGGGPQGRGSVARPLTSALSVVSGQRTGDQTSQGEEATPRPRQRPGQEPFRGVQRRVRTPGLRPGPRGRGASLHLTRLLSFNGTGTRPRRATLRRRVSTGAWATAQGTVPRASRVSRCPRRKS